MEVAVCPKCDKINILDKWDESTKYTFGGVVSITNKISVLLYVCPNCGKFVHLYSIIFIDITKEVKC